MISRLTFRIKKKYASYGVCDCFAVLVVAAGLILAADDLFVIVCRFLTKH